MSLLVDQSGAPGTIRVEGDLHLVNAAQGREIFLQALPLCRRLTVALRGKDELDLAALQLLLAAETEADCVGVTFQYEGTAGVIVAAAMEAVGVHGRERQSVTR